MQSELYGKLEGEVTIITLDRLVIGLIIGILLYISLAIGIISEKVDQVQEFLSIVPIVECQGGDKG